MNNFFVGILIYFPYRCLPTNTFVFFSGVDLVAVLKHFNIGEGTLTKVAASNAGTFVIAYAVHKVFAPLRVAITLTATPFILRYLRKIGFLKHNLGVGK